MGLWYKAHGQEKLCNLKGLRIIKAFWLNASVIKMRDDKKISVIRKALSKKEDM